MFGAHHRDLGFGDLRRCGAERPHELQNRLFTDELAPDAQQVEQRDIGLAEVALERSRVGEPGRPPHAEREGRRHPGALCDLRQCRPGAFGPDEPQGGHAEQAVLLDCLHDLRDRRADLLGEEAQQGEAHVRVRGLRVVQPGIDEGGDVAPPTRRTRGRRSSFPRAARIPSRATGPAARRATPRPRRDLATADRARVPRSSIPAGASQSSAGHAPCQRTAKESGPARSGRSCTATAWPNHSGGKCGSRSTWSPVSAASTCRSARRNSAGARCASSARTSFHVATGARRRAARRARHPSRDHPRVASASNPQSSSAATTSGATSRSNRSARAASTTAPHGSGSSARVARSNWRTQPRSTASGSASVPTSSSSPPNAVRSTVACGAGTSTAISIGAFHVVASDATACPARTVSRASDPAAQSRGGRARVSIGVSSRRTTHPSSRSRPRASIRRNIAIEHGARDAFSKSTAIAPDPEGVATPYVRCTKSPLGTRTAVSKLGATPGRRNRVVVSSAGTCQPSSAPTHQSSETAVAGRTRHRQSTCTRAPRRAPESTDCVRTCQRMPWSSGFAFRSMSSGTRSAGRAPS